MSKQIIQTDKAPSAIGSYSQAVKTSDALYVSGQIPLDPKTMTVVPGGFREQAFQAFQNLCAVIEAAECALSQVVKLTIYVTDLSQFPLVNEVMNEFFKAPYPARAVVEVSALPKQVNIEMDAILSLKD